MSASLHTRKNSNSSKSRQVGLPEKAFCGGPLRLYRV
jgi:hypothetical protein